MKKKKRFCLKGGKKRERMTNRLAELMDSENINLGRAVERMPLPSLWGVHCCRLLKKEGKKFTEKGTAATSGCHIKTYISIAPCHRGERKTEIPCAEGKTSVNGS